MHLRLALPRKGIPLPSFDPVGFCLPAAFPPAALKASWLVQFQASPRKGSPVESEEEVEAEELQPPSLT